MASKQNDPDRIRKQINQVDKVLAELSRLDEKYRREAPQPEAAQVDAPSSAT